MAKMIYTDGNVEKVSPRNGKTFTLDEVYGLIGCGLVEVVDLRDGNILVIDEEGKLKDGAAINWYASAIATAEEAIAYGDCIVGNALYCKTEEF